MVSPGESFSLSSLTVVDPALEWRRVPKRHAVLHRFHSCEKSTTELEKKAAIFRRFVRQKFRSETQLPPDKATQQSSAIY
jgi:hypothetical protein